MSCRKHKRQLLRRYGGSQGGWVDVDRSQAINEAMNDDDVNFEDSFLNHSFEKRVKQQETFDKVRNESHYWAQSADVSDAMLAEDDEMLALSERCVHSAVRVMFNGTSPWMPMPARPHPRPKATTALSWLKLAEIMVDRTVQCGARVRLRNNDESKRRFKWLMVGARVASVSAVVVARSGCRIPTSTKPSYRLALQFSVKAVTLLQRAGEEPYSRETVRVDRGNKQRTSVGGHGVGQDNDPSQRSQSEIIADQCRTTLIAAYSNAASRADAEMVIGALTTHSVLLHNSRNSGDAATFGKIAVRLLVELHHRLQFDAAHAFVRRDAAAKAVGGAGELSFQLHSILVGTTTIGFLTAFVCYNTACILTEHYEAESTDAAGCRSKARDLESHLAKQLGTVTELFDRARRGAAAESGEGSELTRHIERAAGDAISRLRRASDRIHRVLSKETQQRSFKFEMSGAPARALRDKDGTQRGTTLRYLRAVHGRFSQYVAVATRQSRLAQRHTRVQSAQPRVHTLEDDGHTVASNDEGRDGGAANGSHPSGVEGSAESKAIPSPVDSGLEESWLGMLYI